MAGGTGEPRAPILLLLLGLEADQRGAAKAAFWPSYPPYDLWVECPLFLAWGMHLGTMWLWKQVPFLPLIYALAYIGVK